MKTHVIQDDPDPALGATITAAAGAQPARRAGGEAPSHSAQGGRPVGTARAVLIVFGGIGLLIAVALLVSGAAALFALGKQDSNGYFMSASHRLATPSSPLASERLDIDGDAPHWVYGNSFGTSRIRASSTRPVFVGIGPSAEVERYLSRIHHAEITDIDTDPFHVTSHLVPGRPQAAPPASQDFWRVQSSGTGTRTVTWPLQAGQWSVVMMNADGSPGVDVQARFGARVPSLRWVSIGLLAGGLIAVLVSGLLLRLGTHGRRPAR
jgi:hypothetical protein